MMRLRLFSDLHLEFADFQPPPVDCDAVMLAGDIHVATMAVPWIRQHFEVPVLYVLGNHEFYRHSTPQLFERMDEALEDDGLITVLENQSCRIGDTEFFGATLWTDFDLFGKPLLCQRFAAAMMSDYALIRCGEDERPLHPADTVEFHHRSRAWLAEAVAASDAPRKVVISHHAPSLQSLGEEFREEPVSAAYASNLEEYVESLGVDLWVHGHTHQAMDYTIGGTRVMANQRGYMPFDPAPGFRPDLVIEL